MSTLLYVQGSPRVDRSHSRAVADAFVTQWAAAGEDREVVSLDVFTADLPAFDGAAVDAKYAIMHGQKPTDEQQSAWQAVESLIQQFKQADKYVFAVPMWNFGIPYRLKQYFDLITQPGLTFSFSPETGYQGLVTGKPALVVHARGGAYAPGSPAAAYDMEKPYIEQILGFLGFVDVRAILVEPTLQEGPEAARDYQTRATAAALEHLATF